MDDEADSALKNAVKEDEFIRSEWPFMRVVMRCGKELITSSPTEAIYDWHGRKMVKEAYPKMKILREASHFDLIYWKGIGTLMKKKFTRPYATFYTKHIVGFCGVMHHRHNIDKSIPNICPCCGCPDETTEHILLCLDDGRTELYRKSVKQLVDWMRREKTHPTIIRMVQTYLQARNTKTIRGSTKAIRLDGGAADSLERLVSPGCPAVSL